MSPITSLKNVAVAVFFGVLLSACAAETPAPAPEVGFFAGPKVKIDVANVSVVDNYVPTAAAPHVEHKHKVTPSSLAGQWAMGRLAATGSSGTATLTILNASVVEEALPGKTGVEGLVGDYPVAQYVAKIVARLTVVKPGNVPGALSTYHADVNVWSESTLMKNDNLNKRDQAYNSLMKKIAAQFDQSLTREIQRSMSPVILP